MDQQLFLDFEYVFAISVALILLLMYLFYVKYPYGSDQRKNDERSKKSRGSGRPIPNDRKS